MACGTGDCYEARQAEGPATIVNDGVDVVVESSNSHTNTHDVKYTHNSN